MREILIQKFKSDKICNHTLLKTGNRILIEGTANNTWGCGVPLARHFEITLEQTGENKLGKLIQEVRSVTKKI